MKQVVILFFLSLHFSFLAAQCNNFNATGTQIFHANDIRTVINTRGNMFYSMDQMGLQVPYTGSHSVLAVGAAGVWIGGYDENGKLKIATELYGTTGHADYLPGPLIPGAGQYTDNCAEWDTIWSVTRYEILLHIQDYEEHGQVNNPQRTIFGWPGAGNIFFEPINGFHLPDTPDEYAPFFDKNNNAQYEPDQGEYPLPREFNPLAIPDQITWHVFNDFKVHTGAQGDPLYVEIQQTCYAFYCEENSILNRTLFVDFQIVYKNSNALDSAYFALWMDPELGECGIDDYIGCTPEHHSVFVYNHDGLVGSNDVYCDQKDFDQGPGVFSLSFLNKEMSSFMYYANSSLGSWPHVMTDPQSGAPLEFYRVMTGSWISGAPLTIGGTGYSTDPGQVATPFAYPGNPNDSTSWSMLNVDAGHGDFRTVSSTKLGRLEPGQITNISMAFTLHLDTTLSHSGNLELMYEELPYLKEQFASGFTDCEKSIVPCTDDCVWPGDANHDGIANNIDVLQLGFADGMTGPRRSAPLSWAPHKAALWNSSLPGGLNMKHADMNGNGIVDMSSDIGILRTHYDFTHDGFQKELRCEEGDEIIVEGGFASYHPSGFESGVFIRLNAQVVDSLHGLAFTIVYDTHFFDGPIFINLTQPAFDEDVSVDFAIEKPGTYAYAVTRVDSLNEVFFQDAPLASFLMSIRSQDLVIGKHDTTVLCIANILGILADGTEIPMGANTIQFIFLDENATAVTNVAPKHISIYPNPTTGYFYFDVPSNLIGSKYDVQSVSAQLLLSGRITDSLNQLNLPTGVYVLTISTQSEKFVEKIVVLE